jgi:hypothetical protein
MRKNYDKEFAVRFSEGYSKYLLGEWAIAEDIFSECLKMNPNDGPTRTLKNYIDDLNMRAPAGWSGYRALTNK